ncbi:hypothetical protein K439DRAFT_254802 [Ramaria rubella]|nr:hypothetical protein K439DRAFT_254802 [Ramaria rubella]
MLALYRKLPTRPTTRARLANHPHISHHTHAHIPTGQDPFVELGTPRPKIDHTPPPAPPLTSRFARMHTAATSSTQTRTPHPTLHSACQCRPCRAQKVGSKHTSLPAGSGAPRGRVSGEDPAIFATHHCVADNGECDVACWSSSRTRTTQRSSSRNG